MLMNDTSGMYVIVG